MVPPSTPLIGLHSYYSGQQRIRPGYNEANLLETMEVNLRGAATATPS